MTPVKTRGGSTSGVLGLPPSGGGKQGAKSSQRPSAPALNGTAESFNPLSDHQAYPPLKSQARGASTPSMQPPAAPAEPSIPAGASSMKNPASPVVFTGSQHVHDAAVRLLEDKIRRLTTLAKNDKAQPEDRVAASMEALGLLGDEGYEIPRANLYMCLADTQVGKMKTKYALLGLELLENQDLQHPLIADLKATGVGLTASALTEREDFHAANFVAAKELYEVAISFTKNAALHTYFRNLIRETEEKASLYLRICNHHINSFTSKSMADRYLILGHCIESKSDKKYHYNSALKSLKEDQAGDPIVIAQTYMDLARVSEGDEHIQHLQNAVDTLKGVRGHSLADHLRYLSLNGIKDQLKKQGKTQESEEKNKEALSVKPDHGILGSFQNLDKMHNRKSKCEELYNFSLNEIEKDRAFDYCQKILMISKLDETWKPLPLTLGTKRDECLESKVLALIKMGSELVEENMKMPYLKAANEMLEEANVDCGIALMNWYTVAKAIADKLFVEGKDLEEALRMYQAMMKIKPNANGAAETLRKIQVLKARIEEIFMSTF